ncbi:hypothetical protein ABMB44_15390 [Levilactobacillus brevis]
MSQNEELAKQILTAYANGQVDLTNVPDLQKKRFSMNLFFGVLKVTFFVTFLLS